MEAQQNAMESERRNWAEQQARERQSLERARVSPPFIPSPWKGRGWVPLSFPLLGKGAGGSRFHSLSFGRAWVSPLSSPLLGKGAGGSPFHPLSLEKAGMGPPFIPSPWKGRR